jgi:hypothetical protein
MGSQHEFTEGSKGSRSHWWKIAAALFLLSIPAVIAFVAVSRHRQWASETINIPMIPAPEFVKHGPAFTPDGATGQNQNVPAEVAEARKQLAEMERRVYSEKPLLYTLEQYREVPRRWFETRRTEEAALVAEKPDAAKAMERLMDAVACRELLRDKRFATLMEASLQVMPEAVFPRMCSDLDAEIGYQAGAQARVPADGAGRVAYLSEQLSARSSFLDRAVQQKKEQYKVGNDFVGALKVKRAVHMIMDFTDLYIDASTPPELTEARRKARQLNLRVAKNS